MGTSAKEDTTPAAAAPLREDVFLDDIAKQQEKEKAAEKQATIEAEAAAKVAAERKAREAAGAQADDAQVTGLREALRISEEARRRTEERLLSVNATPAAPAKPAEEVLTEEQVGELYRTDPVKAIAYLTQRSARITEENVNKRLDALTAGSAVAAKQTAMGKYPDEFKLFANEIEAITKDPRVSNLNHPSAWDDMIYYVRGQPGNLEKLIQFRVDKEKEKSAGAARETQAASAGAHTKSDIRPPAASGDGELDATERQIAEAIHSDLDPAEAHKAYKSWKGTAR